MTKGHNYSQQNNSPGNARLPSAGCGHSLPTPTAQRPEPPQSKPRCWEAEGEKLGRRRRKGQEFAEYEQAQGIQTLVS